MLQKLTGLRSSRLYTITSCSLYEDQGFVVQDKINHNIVAADGFCMLEHFGASVPADHPELTRCCFHGPIYAQVLKAKVQRLTVPDVTKSFNLPIVGEFSLSLSDIQVRACILQDL